MTFNEFKNENDFRYVYPPCCRFCKWFEGYMYGEGGKCTHSDITGEDERYWVSVEDFNICNKFED